MSAQHPGSGYPGAAQAPGQSPYQERLINFCRDNKWRAPNFQIVSDRRGGRTAWSCCVMVNGASINAQFWYDGQYVNNAREDAAQKALQALGVIERPGVPGQPRQAATQQMPVQYQPGHFYGAINAYSGH